MVLKRLFVTTLGALGLGALAAGSATAQQVPAPDLFDDQVACSSNVPAGMANAALGMALGMTIKDGAPIRLAIDDNSVPIPGNPEPGALFNLNYIIPPGNNNCGAGGPVDHDDDPGTDPVAPSVAGAIAKDVAAGYTETLGLPTWRCVRKTQQSRPQIRPLKTLTDATETDVTSETRNDHGGPGNPGCGPDKASRGAYQAVLRRHGSDQHGRYRRMA